MHPFCSARIRNHQLIFDDSAEVLSAAIFKIFGVSASLSYKIAADGNRDNNVIQSFLLFSLLSVVNNVASTAVEGSANAQAS